MKVNKKKIKTLSGKQLSQSNLNWIKGGEKLIVIQADDGIE